MFNDLTKIISIEWFQFLTYSRTLRLFDSPRCPTESQETKGIRDCRDSCARHAAVYIEV